MSIEQPNRLFKVLFKYNILCLAIGLAKYTTDIFNISPFCIFVKRQSILLYQQKQKKRPTVAPYIKTLRKAKALGLKNRKPSLGEAIKKREKKPSLKSSLAQNYNLVNAFHSIFPLFTFCTYYSIFLIFFQKNCLLLPHIVL